ncbi:hypothetical protein ABW21_db0200666 [Orbilia brochopaga]|nr:hypothetical protein ABW21_db0200666 [Drechslerella brochopaga]
MQGDTAPVKVALIDDGVKSSYARLDDCIDRGKSWARLPKSNRRKSIRRYSQSYNTSQVGHGTVMAYFISRAIEWAVAEKVDIISMSWAIDKTGTENQPKKIKKLRAAIARAADNDILLFCANPDNGAGSETESYPKDIDANRVFCVGAATQEGTPWAKIDPKKNSCDYFLPGVELGFQPETSSARQPNEPPGIWKTYNGSSLSCALAAGLAAMILHCALVSGKNAHYTKLKRHDGMRKAFNSIPIVPSQWLPVRRVFGQSSLLIGTTQDKMKALEEIVDGFI